MPELRFRFVKEGRAAFLSHLDMMRTFQRAFVRADMRVRHSEGFNPHPKMSIAMPLQLGCLSCCEAMDVSLLEQPENAVERLNAVLPEGIRVLECTLPELPVREIAWTDWELDFPSEAAARKAEEALRLPELLVEKKTKRGVGTLDIAPHLTILEREGSRLRLRLRAAEPSVNTGDIAKALRGKAAETLPFRALRTDMKTAALKPFR